MKDNTLVTRRLCVLIAASVGFLPAPAAIAQSSADPASSSENEVPIRRTTPSRH